MIELKLKIYSILEEFSKGSSNENTDFIGGVKILFPEMNPRHLFALVDAVNLIKEYNKSIDMSDFEWLRERSLHTFVSVHNHRILVFNLKNILQITEEDLNL